MPHAAALLVPASEKYSVNTLQSEHRQWSPTSAVLHDKRHCLQLLVTFLEDDHIIGPMMMMISI